MEQTRLLLVPLRRSLDDFWATGTSRLTVRDGSRSRCHMVGLRWQDSAQTTLCYMGIQLQLPHGKGYSSPCPLFGSCLLWPNGWMDQDTTWYGGRPRPRRHCVRWGPSSRRERGTAAHTFRPMSIVAKRSPISATALVLFCFVSFSVGLTRISLKTA